jgi:hypothetical protein
MAKSDYSGINYPFECVTSTKTIKPPWKRDEMAQWIALYGHFYSIVRKRGMRTWCFLSKDSLDKFIANHRGAIL